MTGSAIAAGLLLTCLAFALAFVPRRLAAGSAAVAAVAAVIASTRPAPSAEIAFAGCWISLGVAALSVYWPRLAREHGWLCLAFAVNAGIWAGLVVATEGSMATILAVLPVMLLGVPAASCIDRGWAVAPRVVTSWLLAVAILVGAVPHLVAHPGYLPDHRE